MALTVGLRPRADRTAAESRIVKGVAIGDAYGSDPLAQSFVVTRARNAGTDNRDAAALDTRDLRRDPVVQHLAQNISGDAADSLAQRAEHMQLTLAMIIPRLGKCLGLADEASFAYHNCTRMVANRSLASVYYDLEMPFETVREHDQAANDLEAQDDTRQKEWASRVNATNRHALGLVVDLLDAHRKLATQLDAVLMQQTAPGKPLEDIMQSVAERVRVPTKR